MSKQRCRHRRRVKVNEWLHQAMGPQAEAYWCPDCGALRRKWEKRWRYPAPRRKEGASE